MTLKEELLKDLKEQIERQKRINMVQRWIISFLALAVGFLAR